MAIIVHEASRSKRGCSSFRLKAGVLPFPIGDNKHEDRLLFILFYLKTYPLQEVLAHLFGMSQGLANFLIDQLGHILRETLKRMDHLPERISEEMIKKLAKEEPQDLAIDAAERAIERPNDPERQKRFYSRHYQKQS